MKVTKITDNMKVTKITDAELDLVLETVQTAKKYWANHGENGMYWYRADTSKIAQVTNFDEFKKILKKTGGFIFAADHPIHANEFSKELIKFMDNYKMGIRLTHERIAEEELDCVLNLPNNCVEKKVVKNNWITYIKRLFKKS